MSRCWTGWMRIGSFLSCLLLFLFFFVPRLDLLLNSLSYVAFEKRTRTRRNPCIFVCKEPRRCIVRVKCAIPGIWARQIETAYIIHDKPMRMASLRKRWLALSSGVDVDPDEFVPAASGTAACPWSVSASLELGFSTGLVLKNKMRNMTKSKTKTQKIGSTNKTSKYWGCLRKQKLEIFLNRLRWSKTSSDEKW